MLTSYATKLRAGFHQESVEAFYEGFRAAGIDMPSWQDALTRYLSSPP